MGRYKSELSPKSMYAIPSHTYLSLYHHALQYPEWRARAGGLIGIKGIDYDGMPHAMSVSSPTERSAMKRVELQKLMNEIEETAKEAGPAIAGWLLLGVTEDITYDQLRARGIPCGRKYYYNRRRKFFYLLAKKKKLI